MFGVLAIIVLKRSFTQNNKKQPPGASRRNESLATLAAETDDRGRHARSPSEIFAKGWKDILLRVYANIGEHRILSLAAGVTYYSILAICPALAALVAIYGLFSDPVAIAKHLDELSSVVPSGAIDVAREQLTRLSSKSSQSLGFTFMIALSVSLWSANAAMKSMFDTLNIIYNEQEKRGYIKLNAISLTFTIAGIAFILAALGCVVVIPIILDYLWLSDAADFLVLEMACHVYWLRTRPGVHVSIRPHPANTTLEVDQLGQRHRYAGLACRFGPVLMVCCEFRQV